MSDRYNTIIALLEDPLSMACVVREFERQSIDQMRFLPPPIPRDGGGWVFPAFEVAVKKPLPPSLKAGEQLEFVFEVKTDGTRWIVMTDDGSEIGPFWEGEVALKEAKNFAMEEGFILLSRMPWDNSDILRFPL